MSIKMPEPVAWWNPLKDTASTDPVHRHNDSFKSLITTEQAEAYAKAVRDEALARQATVAYRAIDNAKALASTLHAEAQRLNAESNPDALASERQANAILTDEVESLRKDTERLEFMLRHTQGDALRYAVGELTDTADIDEFRAAIDTAMKEQS